jgi:hypothetical protein
LPVSSRAVGHRHPVIARQDVANQTDSGSVYALPPLDHWEDHGWQVPPTGWTEDEAARQVDHAMRHIRGSRLWEEEIVLGPLVMPLPAAEYEGVEAYHWAVGVKIRNNGTFFVWSPVPLPWLAGYRV